MFKMTRLLVLTASLSILSSTLSLPVHHDRIVHQPDRSLTLGLGQPANALSLPQHGMNPQILQAIHQFEMGRADRRPTLQGAKEARQPVEKRKPAPIHFGALGLPPMNRVILQEQKIAKEDKRSRAEKDKQKARVQDMRDRKGVLGIHHQDTVPFFAFGKSVEELRRDPRVIEWKELVKKIEDGKMKWTDLRGPFKVRTSKKTSKRNDSKPLSASTDHSLSSQVQRQKEQVVNDEPRVNLSLGLAPRAKDKGKRVVENFISE
jgi:hypothetical protein